MGNSTERFRHRTNHWYSRYQALVRSVPAIGTRRTNDWYLFHAVSFSWLYAAIGLFIAVFRESRASISKDY
ncbi:MAG: hypothetical protein SPI30_10545 [Prevotella sp.]|nr:hypothetical protein [Prevotella sp.]